MFVSACAAKPPAPIPDILPCYKAATYAEYARLIKQKAKKPNDPLVVAGVKFACVDSALPTEPTCYLTKTTKEFDRLSLEQEKRPAWPVKVGKKYYRCIQEREAH